MDHPVVGLGTRRRLARFAVLAVAGLAAAGSAWPAQHAQAQVGFGCVSTGNGVQMRVDMSWVDGSGYRPISVQVTASGTPSADDRTFSVRLRARWRFMPSSPAVSVVEHFVMPAGSNQASVVLTLPSYFTWNHFDVELFEDGEYLDKVSQRDMYVGMPTAAWQQREARLLVASSTTGWPAMPMQLVAGTSNSVRRFPIQPPLAGQATSAVLLLPPPEADVDGVFPGLRQSLQSNQAAVASIAGLPERWQQYLALDVVLISLDDLLLLVRSHPRRLAALLGWVHAGGTLIVGELHEDYARLAELERAIGLAAQRELGDDFRARGWFAPDPARWQPPSQQIDSSQFPGMSGALPRGGSGGPGAAPGAAIGAIPRSALPVPPMPIEDAMAEGAVDPSVPQRPGPDARPFLLRPYGLGTVVALGNDGPIRVTAADWAWLRNILDMRATWERRHGVDLVGGNSDFWEFLIPGVGLAPRWTFLLLISVFVVVIGPVNYFWLRRRQKLYLLLVLVPSFAALVTLGLFAYAMMADGLGVRVRVRSLTEIDQRVGRATSWSRLSYYAGLAPSDGLTFSEDVAILPIEPHEMLETKLQRQRTLEWADGKQYLRRGWLPSRVPTQYLAMRTRATKAGLRILGRKGKGLRVRNELGTNLERLLVCDEQGAFYAAARVGAGEDAVLAPADLVAEAASFRAAVQRHRLQVPEGFSWRGVRVRRWRYFYSRYDAGTQQTNLLESAISRLLQACDAGGQGLLTEPRTYVAIGESSPEVEVGVAAAPEASLFLIQGRW